MIIIVCSLKKIQSACILVDLPDMTNATSLCCSHDNDQDTGYEYDKEHEHISPDNSFHPSL